MAWTQIRCECALEALDTVAAVMSMIDNGLMIEDYSDVTEGLNAIYGELLDEEIMKKDKTRGAVSVYLSEDRNVAETLETLKDRFMKLGIDVKTETFGLKEEDWANSWKKYYKPVHIGSKVVIAPMWEEYKPLDGEVVVKMDPGMAFGSGTHETTALCAELIEKYLKKGMRTLDVGTGSGILAILASKLGAQSVDALDIDANAVTVAKENCVKNGVSNVECRQSDLIKSAKGKYDFVSANIVADIVIRMSEDVGNIMKDDGLLVVSGIIEEQRARVTEAFAKKGFCLVDESEKNDWNAFVFKKSI